MYFSHKMFPAEVEIPEVSFSKFLKSIQSNVYRINVLFRKPWNNSVVKTFIIIIKDIFIEIQYNLYKNVSILYKNIQFAINDPVRAPSEPGIHEAAIRGRILICPAPFSSSFCGW